MIVGWAIVGIIFAATVLGPAKGLYTIAALMKAKARQSKKEVMEINGVQCEIVVDDFMDERGVAHTEFWVATMKDGRKVVITTSETRAMTSCDPGVAKLLMDEICKRKSRQVVER